MPERSGISRRRIVCVSLFAGLSLAGLAACKRRDNAEDRCGFCGMKIDPTSAWTTELVVGGKTLRFDSPKCALSAWRERKLAVDGSRFQEFYTRAPRDAGALVFARGSDVTGPMGAELVPLDPASAAKFVKDHAAKDTLKLDQITPELLTGI